MIDNENKNILEIQKKIKEKQDAISKIQINQYILENKIQKLELIKNKINTGKKSILRIILSRLISCSIMVAIIILFIIGYINKFDMINTIPHKKYIIGIYTGVISISLFGTFISSIIEKKLNKLFNKIKIKKIMEKEIEYTRKLNLEKNKQNILMNMITEIMYHCDDKVNISLENKSIALFINEEKNEKITRNKPEEMNTKKRIKKKNIK